MVGAYERDNVGDLLFLLVTEPYLPGAEIVASAPFSADMTDLLDRPVHAYGPLLRRERFDAIWTVGGQVGRIDPQSAYRLSATPEEYRAFQRSSASERAELLRRAAGGVDVLSPYIPSPLDYPANAGTVTVVNSAGLDGIRTVERYRREELLSLLRGTTIISVRDKPSSDFLTNLGIEHRLVPDAVHALGVLHPGERDPGSDIAVVQASQAVLANLGLENVATRIATSRALRGLRIRLLLAGTATGHDSVADYEKLGWHVRRQAPGTDIEIILDRRPLDLVDHIRCARVVVCTSLHVRIIASVYGVPRVSLTRPKATKYAATWDRAMPYDVSLDELDAAIEAAWSAADQPETLAWSAELAQRAHDNLTDLARQVTTLTNESPQARARRAETRRHHQAGLLASRTDELRRLRRELAAIRSSRTYRLAARGSKVGRVLRRFGGGSARPESLGA